MTFNFTAAVEVLRRNFDNILEDWHACADATGLFCRRLMALWKKSMCQPLLRLTTVAMIVMGLAVSGSNSANAQTVMKQCGEQWQAAKAAGTTNGETWPQFLKDCRARLASTTSAPPQGGFAPAAPAPVAPAPTAPATGYLKTASQCDAEYAANKAAIRASGQTKREFVAACRAGNETIPQGAAAAPAPGPGQTGSLFPWQQPAAPTPAPAPSSYGAPAPTTAGQFTSPQEAQSRCPGATVVWVNEHSHIYHFAGTRDYGNTKRGAYMCEADAQAAGNRAAKNERHP